MINYGSFFYLLVFESNLNLRKKETIYAMVYIVAYKSMVFFFIVC